MPLHAPRVRAASPGRCAPLALSLAIAAGLGPAAAGADIVLNEVLYDPVGADEGREFVELWNPDPLPRPLAGVRVESGDGARPDVWAVVYAGSSADTIPPGTTYLIQGTSLEGPLQNGPDAVRLTRDGALLDLLGYGDLEPAALYLGAPAPDVPSGQSLARVRDGEGTGVNRDDWAPEAAPTPGRPNHPDVRLAFTSRSSELLPEVPWPGEALRVTAWVRNQGRLALEAGQWSAAFDRLPWPRDVAAEDPAAVPIATVSGTWLLPADSVALIANLPAPLSAGPFLVRATVAARGAGPTPVSTDTVLTPARAGAGPAVVSEFAFHGAGEEWVEVALVDSISDWGALVLSDRSGRAYAIDRGAAPRPGGAGDLLVLAESPGSLRARFLLPENAVLGLRGGWPSLNDEDGADGIADVIRLAGSDGVPCDAVPYAAGWTERGGSVERLATDLPSAARRSWGESIDPTGGTPGRPNSLRAPRGAPHVRGALLAAPTRRLLRAGGSVLEPVALRLTEEARGRCIRIDVRDLRGRSLRCLAAGQRFGGAAAFLWDGRDDRGLPVPPGIYTVRAEAEAEPGLPSRATTLSLIVAEGAPR
jgi:hypothetical protein